MSQNIKNFSQEGDVVLDSFGGSGVTAIEAMMNNRVGIHIDLNPLSVFMTKALSYKIDLGDLWDLSEEILKEFEKISPKDENEAKEILKNAKYYPNAINDEFGEIASSKKQDSILWIPKDEILPKGSDVDNLLGLFSPVQLCELALLRRLIFKRTKNYKEMRMALMLAFYNTLSLANLTFHKTPNGGGNYFAYYHSYRIAPDPTFVNIKETFMRKVSRVIKGKSELDSSPYFYKIYDDKNIFQGDATNLEKIESTSIDFIYTDPPYGAKIAYLDLSIMWNGWLDFRVDNELKAKECIEKGSLNKTRDDYHKLMIESLKEMYRVLKYNRYLSFVFQHQDPQLWQILVENAENIGFEYIGCERQSNGQSTFVKRKNPFSVLSGQLIMYFKKVENPKARVKENLGGDTYALMLNNIEALIARDDGATLEEIYGELTIKGLELGFLHEIGKNWQDLTPIINQNFDFDEISKKYHIKKREAFKSHNIPLAVRTKYFIISFLRGCERQGKKANFDDICLEVIPLTKNGITASKESILEILNEIALKDSNGTWRIKKSGEQELF